MNRVLVTGGAGTLGGAVVQRLLRDPDYEVRVSDQREAPTWMREGCEIHTGDLRDIGAAREAAAGCTHVIHAAATVGGIANFDRMPHTLTEVNNALFASVIRAALDHDVDRFVYVSSARVFERATKFPTPEEHLEDCPLPYSAYGFSKLTGEIYCRAAAEEHGLPYTICRPFTPYGPTDLCDVEPGFAQLVPDLVSKTLAGQRPLQIIGSGKQTRTLTHLDDVAEGIVSAMSSPAGLREDFNFAGSEERTIAEIAKFIWVACGRERSEFELEHIPSGGDFDVARRYPSTAKAQRLLGWKPRIGLEEGLRETVAWLRGRVGAVA
jgi:nucleoside-diphosphate-sugar epimerase